LLGEIDALQQLPNQADEDGGENESVRLFVLNGRVELVEHIVEVDNRGLAQGVFDIRLLQQEGI